MSRSLKIRSEWIPKAKAAVRRNGFLTQQRLAENLGIARSTLSNFLTGRVVDSAIFEEISAKLNLDWREIADFDFKVTSPNLDNKPDARNQRQDWGEVKDVSVFYGRSLELATLEQWVIPERCRLITVSGMGGIGKTTLVEKLAKQIQHEFDYIICKSLRNAPPIAELLIEIINFLVREQSLPENIDAKVSLLLNYLRNSRCLLVLDNVESILCTDGRAGCYRQNYEGYAHLLRCIGESEHQSCAILTSREIPKGLSTLCGENTPIRSLRLTGLQQAASQEIFVEKGLAITQADVNVLVESYAGNPLALKIVATYIQKLFDCDVREFLAQHTFSFGDISDLLQQQFNRLSILEKQVMYWLAINREWVAIADLEADIIPTKARKELIEALTSLQARSLIEHNFKKYSLQPVVMEYVIDQLLEQVCQEISSKIIGLFDNYALIKAQAKDYIRNSQIELIVKPACNRLLSLLGTQENVQNCLQALLATLKKSTPKQPGYAAGNILNLCGQLQIDISGWEFSNLTIWQAYLQGVNLYAVDFTNSDLSKSVFTQILGGILSAAFSPNGKLLATGFTHETCVWEVATQRKLMTCKGYTAWAMAIAFSLDGQILATGSNDNTIRLWNVNTGQCLKTLSGHDSWVETIAFSPDGQILASGSNDRTIGLWNVRSKQYIKPLLGHTGRILFVAFSPDNRTLVSSAEDGTVKVWNINNGECLHTWDINTNWMLSIALSPDGQTLATGSDRNTVKLWHLQTGKCIATLPSYSSFVWAVDFSADGKLLVTADEDNNVNVWDVATLECLHTLREHNQRVWLAAFSPDGQTLLSISDDRTAKFWDVSAGKSLSTLVAYSNWVSAVAFSPDGETLASTHEDCLVRLWDISAKKTKKILSGHTDIVSTVSFAPQNCSQSNIPMLVTGSYDKTIKLWHTLTGELLQTLEGHNNWVWSVAFSPNGNTLASCSHDRTIILWDCTTGEQLHVLGEHIGPVKSVAFSYDGTTLASCSDDKTIKLWDVLTGNCKQTFAEHEDLVAAVAFSPCGQAIASASADQTVKIWHTSTGKCLHTLRGHERRVRSVAFSPTPIAQVAGGTPGGGLLASGSDDRTVIIWDVNTGDRLKTFYGHEKVIWSVAFSIDGLTVASGSQDENIKLWRVDNRECLTFRASRPYEGMKIAGIIGLTDSQKATLKALGAVSTD